MGWAASKYRGGNVVPQSRQNPLSFLPNIGFRSGCVCRWPGVADRQDVDGSRVQTATFRNPSSPFAPLCRCRQKDTELAGSKRQRASLPINLFDLMNSASSNLGAPCLRYRKPRAAKEPRVRPISPTILGDFFIFAMLRSPRIIVFTNSLARPLSINSGRNPC